MLQSFEDIDVIGSARDGSRALAVIEQQLQTMQTMRYQLLEDPNDGNVAYMYELYTDGGALQAHSTSDVMKQIMNAFGGILAGRPELTMLTPVRGKGL